MKKVNGRYEFLEDGKSVKYTRYDGNYFIIDAEDYQSVSSVNWYPRKIHGYERRTWFAAQLKQYLHQFILSKDGIDVPDGYEIDHINRNPYDNRKQNLRVVTHQENMMNQSIRTTNKKWRQRCQI